MMFVPGICADNIEYRVIFSAADKPTYSFPTVGQIGVY